MTDAFCALASIEASEPLVGSAAADTRRWLLLEHGGTWAAKPLRSPGLEPVREQLEAWDAAEGTRLQLIRRPDRAVAGPVRMYVGFSGDTGPWLVRFDLADLDELRDIDLDAVARDGSHPRATRVGEPLHLVCTHGKRDRCCAKWGMPVFHAMERVDRGRVWQTSHTGGHRFAANVLSFPHGVSYGRIEPDQAPGIVEAHRDGRLFSLEHLRGRTCYDAPTQAAEAKLRAALGRLDLDALIHRGTDVAGEDRWQARFEVDGVVHTLDVTREQTGAARPKSCGDPPVPIDRYI